MSGLVTLSTKDKVSIFYGNNKYYFTMENLIKNKHLHEFKNIKIQAYSNMEFNLVAIRLCDFLNPIIINNDSTIKIIAKDDFFAYIQSDEINQCTDIDRMPYVVIQKDKRSWPQIKGNHEEVGTFSLIWLGKKSKSISREKWVRNISKIYVLKKNDNQISSAYKNLNLSAKKGQNVFIDNCSGCHSLDLKGQLNIGPDLNFPMNPLGYFSEKILKQFIRDPQSVRYYKNAKMEGFGKELLSDHDLDDLINFMKKINKQKKASNETK